MIHECMLFQITKCLPYRSAINATLSILIKIMQYAAANAVSCSSTSTFMAPNALKHQCCNVEVAAAVERSNAHKTISVTGRRAQVTSRWKSGHCLDLAE